MARNTPIPHIPIEDKTLIRGLVIHEDAAVLAFNKPSGLPSQVRGNRGRNLDHLLWTFAKSNGKRPRLVHRLDSGTSGVIIAARTQPAAAALSAAFEGRTAQKTYLAVVSGILPDMDSGTIDAPIARVPTDRGDQIVAARAGTKGAKSALTKWRIISRAGTAALMELKPETGRMHQIRVHLAHLGCPIMGDHIYGDKASAPRLMLHAAALDLPHPGGSMLSLAAPMPEDMAGFAASLSITNPPEGETA